MLVAPPAHAASCHSSLLARQIVTSFDSLLEVPAGFLLQRRYDKGKRQDHKTGREESHEYTRKRNTYAHARAAKTQPRTSQSGVQLHEHPDGTM